MKFTHTCAEIISVENLLAAWQEFARGKKKKPNVQEFQLRLMSNILSLHADLRNRVYRHGPYRPVKINDPKPRDIHVASVRDRLLHHALYRTLYPYFDQTFIFDSYSCRRDKGTHHSLNRFRALASWVDNGNRRTCFVLKCDIRKFFANIDHGILKNMLARHITDADTSGLLESIIDSFHTKGRSGIGLPLGNLTSQLLVNIYMNEFDQFVKHTLKVKYYIRYADDFIILHNNKRVLIELIPNIKSFLLEKLKLTLHPDKVFIKTIASGVDFLGWVHFPDHRVLRTATKRRMFARANERNESSYLGLLSHGNARKLQAEVRTIVSERSSEG